MEDDGISGADGASGLSGPSRALGIVLAVAALAAALYWLVSTVNASPAVYGEKDAGGEIVVRAGEHFVLELPDDPDSGFGWVVEPPRPDASVLRFVGERYEAGGPAADGAAGTRRLEFEAKDPGRTRVHLRHCFGRCTDRPRARESRSVNFRVVVE